jgi:prepilin-type N-terminal cleavage/methylation domain-containing protein
MRTSIRGTRNRAGFTLVELAVVLFVLGLVLWVAAPRLSLLGEPGRDAVFRDLSSGSEAAYDLALFGKRETRLVIDPSAGTYVFRAAEQSADAPAPRRFGANLSITGIRIRGEDRPLDLPTEIPFAPGGVVPAARIFFRDSGEGPVGQWTLRLSPFDGSMKILEGTVRDDG